MSWLPFPNHRFIRYSKSKSEVSTKLSMRLKELANVAGVTAAASKWKRGSRRARSALLMMLVADPGESGPAVAYRR